MRAQEFAKRDNPTCDSSCHFKYFTLKAWGAAVYEIPMALCAAVFGYKLYLQLVARWQARKSRSHVRGAFTNLFHDSHRRSLDRTVYRRPLSPYEDEVDDAPEAAQDDAVNGQGDHGRGGGEVRIPMRRVQTEAARRARARWLLAYTLVRQPAFLIHKLQSQSSEAGDADGSGSIAGPRSGGVGCSVRGMERSDSLSRRSLMMVAGRDPQRRMSLHRQFLRSVIMEDDGVQWFHKYSAALWNQGQDEAGPHYPPSPRLLAGLVSGSMFVLWLGVYAILGIAHYVPTLPAYLADEECYSNPNNQPGANRWTFDLLSTASRNPIPTIFLLDCKLAKEITSIVLWTTIIAVVLAVGTTALHVRHAYKHYRRDILLM